MSYALRALKKNIIKQEKQEKTRLVLFCFTGFILFFYQAACGFCTRSTLGRLYGKNLYFFRYLVRMTCQIACKISDFYRDNRIILLKKMQILGAIGIYFDFFA